MHGAKTIPFIPAKDSRREQLLRARGGLTPGRPCHDTQMIRSRKRRRIRWRTKRVLYFRGKFEMLVMLVMLVMFIVRPPGSCARVEDGDAYPYLEDEAPCGSGELE